MYSEFDYWIGETLFVTSTKLTLIAVSTLQSSIPTQWTLKVAGAIGCGHTGLCPHDDIHHHAAVWTILQTRCHSYTTWCPLV